MDEETREQFQRIDDQFRRVIDVVIETRTAVDQEFASFREEARGNQDRILTAIDGMSKELRDLRQEDVTDIRRHLSDIDARLRSLEARRDPDA